MSWFKKVLPPGLRPAPKGAKRSLNTDAWQPCPACKQLLHAKELSAQQHTCHACGHHLKWGIDARLNALCVGEETTREVIAVDLPADDPLGFKDKKTYKNRLKDARGKAANPEANGGKTVDAFRVCVAEIGEAAPLSGEAPQNSQPQKAVIFAMDFAFMAGSMGRAVGEALVVAAQEAKKRELPLLAITASGGARMQESVFSLMQMTRTTAALNALKDARLPYITLLTNPTTGGVTASFAMTGDVTLAEPGALIGFAGPRVIQQTIQAELPEGFQTAEYLVEHGMVDAIVPRAEQPAHLANLLGLLMENRKGHTDAVAKTHL